MKPVSRMAELLTIISLILAGFTILPDLGQPVRGIVNLFLYARPQSPFFGTFTLVIAGYLFASLVYFFLDARRDAALCARIPGRLQGFYRLWASGYRDTPAERERHERTSFWLAIAIVPLLVTAHSTLGFIFGIQVGRPGWYSALQAPAFVVMAGVSGIGLLIIIAAILRQVLGETEQLNEDIFKWLGSLLMVLTVVYLYFMVVEWLTATYTGSEREVRTTMALLTGQYAWLYWVSVGSLAAAFGILVVTHLPVPIAVRLPVFLPRYARIAGLAALVLAVIIYIQAIPVTTTAALMPAAGVSLLLPYVLIVLLLLFAISILPEFRRNVIGGAVVSGILVNVAAIGKRILIVVPSQTHGPLLPYPIGSYSPTWVEYSIIVGLFALGTLLYILFMKVFPIMEVAESTKGGVR